MATNSVPPSKRAEEIIEKLPSSPNLITKTGTALLGTGLIAAAISQELYVVNEESIVLLAFVIVMTYLGKVTGTIFERYMYFSDLQCSPPSLPSFYGR
jgi:F-type H+-transporting ATPase subunit b